MFIVQPAGASPYYCGAAGFAAAMSCQAAAAAEAAVTLNRKASGLSRCGKLRRSGSSLSRESSSSLSSTAIHGCIAEARQIELDFTSWAGARACRVRVRAPTGEESGPLRLADDHDTQRFSPSLPGCGHGVWTITVEDETDETKQTSVSISLEGVGSLFFTIDEHLNARLTSQEFLVLPHTSMCTKDSAF